MHSTCTKSYIGMNWTVFMQNTAVCLTCVSGWPLFQSLTLCTDLDTKHKKSYHALDPTFTYNTGTVRLEIAEVGSSQKKHP